MIKKMQQIKQIMWFGSVGISAMSVHWLSVVWLVTHGYEPLQANVIAFMLAFQISYWGHRHLTFAATDIAHQQSFPRFALTAVSMFILNEFLFFLLLSYSSLSYQLALFIVLGAVSVITFLLNKYWVFNK